MWCIPEITPEYEQRMMDVLEVYERPYDPAKPVICFDEKSVPLRGTTRDPRPMKPGKIARHDSEYTREGTANVFMTIEPQGNHREAAVTERRKKGDFAREMKRLADEVYPKAATIVTVLDNLKYALREIVPGYVFPGGSGAAYRQIRVPSHSEARLLAQHGRNRDRRVCQTVPAPRHRFP